MPKLTKAEKERLPSTLERSDAHAQETYVRALESAEQVRGHEGDEAYAHRVAFAAVKRGYEKVGDHWEPKPGGTGPSDARAERGGPGTAGATAGGVDANATKAHLLDLAKQAGISGRTRMSKDDLVDALDRHNRRETARARER